MKVRRGVWGLGAAVAAVVACLGAATSSLGAGQGAGSDAAWTPPRTAWGDVDLQGTWTNFNTASTSIEAPGGPQPRLMGGTGSCIPSGTTAPSSQAGVIGAGPEHWYETKPAAGGRVGLIVEPSNGRLPALTQAADQRRDGICRRIFDSYVYLDPWVRCISRGIPASMFPSAYNNAYQILQTKDHVVIVYEMIHDARIIPLDRLERAGSNISLWMGSARARWEGTSLVVETTNFHDRGAIRGHPHTDALRVVERFTPIDATTLAYETTVEDPKTWTASWKAAITLNRDDEYEMFEYACHEGNLAVENILSGARLEEREKR